MDLWESLAPEQLDAPDDWSGPFDDIDDDVISSYEDDSNTRKSWDSVLEGYEDN